jgi:3-hydroxyacyl-CoA dehydrogenase
MGLVECGVGLVPGWGGCGEMIARWLQDPTLPQGPMPAVAKVFETISMANVSKSAAEAKDLHFLRKNDGITMNRDRLLYDAKSRVLELAENYAPPKPQSLTLPGPSGRLGMNMAAKGLHKQGLAFDHDLIVADELAGILSGGKTDLVEGINETNMLALERQAFMRLVKTGPSLARIEHMLETGKPLRN